MAEHINLYAFLNFTTWITSRMIPNLFTNKRFLSLHQTQSTTVNRNLGILPAQYMSVRTAKWKSNLQNDEQVLHVNNKDKENTSKSVVLNVTIDVPLIENIHTKKGCNSNVFIENIETTEKVNDKRDPLFNQFSSTVESQKCLELKESSSKVKSRRISKDGIPQPDKLRLFMVKDALSSLDNTTFKFSKLVKRSQESVRSIKIRQLHKRSTSNTITKMITDPHLIQTKKAISNSVCFAKQIHKLNEITEKSSNNTKNNEGNNKDPVTHTSCCGTTIYKIMDKNEFTKNNVSDTNNKLGIITVEHLWKIKQKYKIIKNQSLFNQIQKVFNEISLTEQEETTKIGNNEQNKLEQLLSSDRNILELSYKDTDKNFNYNVNKQSDSLSKTVKEKSDCADCNGSTCRADNLRPNLPKNLNNHTVNMLRNKPNRNVDKMISVSKNKLNISHLIYSDNVHKNLEEKVLENKSLNTATKFRTTLQKNVLLSNNICDEENKIVSDAVNCLKPIKLAESVENVIRKKRLFMTLSPLAISTIKVMTSMISVYKPNYKMSDIKLQETPVDAKQSCKLTITQESRENNIIKKVNKPESIDEKHVLPMKKNPYVHMRVNSKSTVDQPMDETLDTEKLIEIKITELCKSLLELMKLLSISTLKDIERGKRNKCPGKINSYKKSDILTNQSFSYNKEPLTGQINKTLYKK